jgi:hypothetical protein
MDDSSPDVFPGRMLTTTEVGNLKNHVQAFAYTAPIMGLSSLEKGPRTNSRAVIGIYIGFIDNGAHFMGFDPTENDWESASILDPEDQDDEKAFRESMKSLVKWIDARFPGEKFAMYGRVSLRANLSSS